MTTIRLKIAAIVYGLLALVAVGWGFLVGRPDIFHHPEAFMEKPLPWVVAIVLGGAAGVAFGMGIAWLSRHAVYKFEWAKGLHMEFRGLFGPLRDMDIFAFAFFSSIGEEMFFRGILQTELGIIPASLIFGLLHMAPNKKYIPWPFQAIAMGFAFGGLYWLSGNLIAPILAHFTINYQNLHFINRYDPSLQLPKSFKKTNQN